MTVTIEKAAETGFCFGVQRAINILEKAAAKYGSVDSLGAVVHNEQVSQRLNKLGIKIIHNVSEIKSDVVAISSHGVSPQVEAELKSHSREVIDTTCPFVKRAQLNAKKLAEAGFKVIVYGEAQHSEVKGILGWAQEKGLAILDTSPLLALNEMPRRLGILSQTTQVPVKFNNFVKETIDLTLAKDTEMRIIDTICHDIRKRQSVSLELAGKVDLMLVVGGHSSANAERLQEICSEVVETHLIDSVKEINLIWLKGKKDIGVTSGTSTPEDTVDKIIKRLATLSN
jgi:4-hydroxy-3-methylbut-2-en-1-yl diphosphate reductase